MADATQQAQMIYDAIRATSGDRPFAFQSLEQLHRGIASWQAQNPALTALRQASPDVQTAFLSRSVEWLKQDGDPVMRVATITIHPLSDPANLFPMVLGLGLGDRVTVTRVGMGGADFRGISGEVFNCSSTSAIAASNCTSWPAFTATGSSATSTSGATPSFSTCHSPSGVNTRKNGTVRKPPSMSGGFAEIPIKPPQVRVPMSLPKPKRLNP